MFLSLKLLADVECVAVFILEVLVCVVVLDAVDDLGEDVAGRSGDAQLFAVLCDLAVKDVDLGLTLMEQSVLAHGGIVVADVGDDVGMVVCDEIVGVHGNTLCGRNGAGLTDYACLL